MFYICTMDAMTNFKELCLLKNFSEQTINNYIGCLKSVSIYFGCEIEKVTEKELRKFLLSQKHYSSSTRMMYINAFKCFYRLCFDKDFDHKILPRPKVEQKQPDILSVEEVQQIISSIKNIKHKAIVCLMYSCAMRSGEVINLKIKDIDSKNNKINIKNGKGKIDRIVMLDNNLLEILREYYRHYQTNKYLFEGAKGGKYTSRSIQGIIKRAIDSVGINKKISPHSMRHSCITQLIKDGCDIRSVQKLAGHKNINTTANYIKIIDSDVLAIKSPLSKIII